MYTRRLGGTDLDLSVIGFGCWAAGGLWWGDDVRDEEVVEALCRARDLGVNWFDTAPLYGHGHADALLRRSFGEGLRDVVVATKCGPRWDGLERHAHSDLRPEHLVEDVDASLRRLGLQRIDLLQVHWPCERGTPLQDTMGALDRLREAGKVRWVGLCNYDADGLARARALGRVEALQTPLSMLRREYERALGPACARDGIGVVVYEPLARGLLAGKFSARTRFPESDLRARDHRFQGDRFLRALTLVERVRLVATKVAATPAQLALGWTLRAQAVTSAIVGVKRVAQLEEAVRAADLDLAAPWWREIDAIVAAHRG